MATERIPQGGALTLYNPAVAAQSYARNPGYTYEQLINNPRVKGAEKAVRSAVADPTKVRAGGAGAGAVFSGIEDILSGNVLGGTVGIGTGLATAPLINRGTNALMNRAAAALPGPLKALPLAGKFLLPTLAGGAVASTTSDVVSGTRPGPDMPNTGGLFGLGGPLEGVPFIGEGARQSRIQARARQERQKDIDQDLANVSRYATANAQIASAQMEAMMPSLERLERMKRTSAQAMLNTQGQIYQQLGRQAGMFQLTNTGMQEAGATARTFLKTSPMNQAVIQAPQITFGR